jgi:hypothetical protein
MLADNWCQRGSGGSTMKSHARLLVDIRKCGSRAQGELSLNQEMSREIAGRHPKMWLDGIGRAEAQP